MVVRKFRITTKHGAIAGKTQEIEVNAYNLDAIISVGYRVKSSRGTQFRIWATKQLKEFIHANLVFMAKLANQVLVKTHYVFWLPRKFSLRLKPILYLLLANQFPLLLWRC